MAEKKSTSKATPKATKAAPKKAVKKEAAPKAEKVVKKVVAPAAKSETAVAKTKKVKTSSLKVPKDFHYGTGKRKSAIAKVWLFKGKGAIILNDEPIEKVMNKPSLISTVLKPIQAAGIEGKYDIKISTIGGGVVGQSHACSLGIARAILEMNESFKTPLRADGLLTRDARVKERKKYGRKKARKGYQFRKR
jgi:small subunit ribosomal protein S9